MSAHTIMRCSPQKKKKKMPSYKYLSQTRGRETVVHCLFRLMRNSHKTIQKNGTRKRNYRQKRSTRAGQAESKTAFVWPEKVIIGVPELIIQLINQFYYSGRVHFYDI